MENIFGCLHQIISKSSKTKECVALFNLEGIPSPILVQGIIPEVYKLNDYLYLTGTWKHLNEQKYFHIQKCSSAPIQEDNQTVIHYLKSSLIKGIGFKTAEKIVAHFKGKTIFVLDQTPEQLIQVKGISRETCNSLVQQLNEQRELRKVIFFLKKYQISINQCVRIYKKYKEKTIEIICQNPFLLAYDVDRIGFKTADQIAARLGMSKDAPQRICAGILHVLQDLEDEGHTCIDITKLSLLVKKLLSEKTEHQISFNQVEQQIALLQQSNTLHTEQINNTIFVWKKSLFHFEQIIVRRLRHILLDVSPLSIHASKALEWVNSLLQFSLEDTQKEAVISCFSNKTHIVSGGPGTGKSTIIQAILHVFEKKTKKIILAAPTGKAAKRMSEITQRRAITIHSALQYDFHTYKFRKHEGNPLDCDVMIIDEFSMVDSYLFAHLLSALPNHIILILIGDVNQLPSIGAGNILKDLIESKQISVTLLHKIFRQAQNSNIIVNAHNVKSGLMLDLAPKSGRKDFLFYQKDHPQDALNHIIYLMTDFIPNKYHIYKQDIQVLAPMKKAILGTHNLNKELKKHLNISEDSNKSWGIFSCGDKVMQIKNNYSKKVFNGDIGYIVHIDHYKKQASIKFDDQYVHYSFLELNEITLAYAISVHKYQGSESQCVIIPVHTSHYIMLFRSLLYTAITRGKKLVILVGTKKAVSIAINNNKAINRCTGLIHSLKQVI